MLMKINIYIFFFLFCFLDCKIDEAVLMGSNFVEN